VRQAGKRIGQVREVRFNEQRGGVDVLAEIDREVRLFADARPRILATLLGDAVIEFIPGRPPSPVLSDGDKVDGEVAPDLMQVVHDMQSMSVELQEKVAGALDSIADTAEQWNDVGARLSRVLDDNDERLAQVLDQTSQSLTTFQQAMDDARAVLGDRELQENMRVTFEKLPELADMTRETLTAMRATLAKADENLENLKGVTGPLSQRTDSLLKNLDDGGVKINILMSELTDFTRQLQNERGSFHQFVNNPNLYHNLDQAARSLNLVLQTMEPASRDLRIFADKIARHPELIGIQGYLQGSSGIK
jgi:phospholipid/cholesterol/gamma-HCH transport system substrate-binding protein